jgi:hypothetical protein
MSGNESCRGRKREVKRKTEVVLGAESVTFGSGDVVGKGE